MANRKHAITLNDQVSKDVALMIKDAILNSGDVRVVGLGTFVLRKIKGKRGFNPGTKKYENFEPYLKVSFVPSMELKNKLKLCQK